MANELVEKGLAVLPDNEPIDWLLGSALRSCAARGDSHFILEAMAGKNPSAVKAWNAWIAEFRSVLLNPDETARKADAELGTSASTRIDDFMSEVFAVLRLSRAGYRDFEAVLAGKPPTVDYVARREGKRVRIEVKRLNEAQDIIRNIARERWRENRTKYPEKFNFRAVLNHSHHGPLSEKATSKLYNVIDQFPDRASGDCTEALDVGISVRLRRIPTRGASAPDTDEGFLQTTMFPPERTGLLVTSTITEQDLEFDLPELQRLFVKAMRTVADATKKFFGRQTTDPEAENLIAMEWEAPKVFFDDSAPSSVAKAIEGAFSAVGLQLKVMIFGGDIRPNYEFLRRTSESESP
jgi:hypothetical protein